VRRHGTSYLNSVQLIVEVILQSPQMVYASELGPDAAPSGSTVTLTQQEVASQLSLLLTGARPDEDLLRAAMRGGSPTLRKWQVRSRGFFRPHVQSTSFVFS
jgi:hypothetical protein